MYCVYTIYTCQVSKVSQHITICASLCKSVHSASGRPQERPTTLKQFILCFKYHDNQHFNICNYYLLLDPYMRSCFCCSA